MISPQLNVVRTLVALQLFFPAVVLAADNGFYAGASVSEPATTYRGSYEESAVAPFPRTVAQAEAGTPFKVVAGFRPLEHLAIEASYVDLAHSEKAVTSGAFMVCAGSCPIDRISLDARALSVSAVAHVGKVFFARGGIARWELDRAVELGFRTGPPALPVPRKTYEGTDFTYGAGAQVRVASFALRIEYERFEFSSDSAESLSIGFVRDISRRGNGN